MKKGKLISRTLVVILVVILLVVIAFVTLNEFYINIKWFSEVNYLSVFFKELFTKLKLGLPLFLGLFIILSIYFKLLTLSGGKQRVVNLEKKSFVKSKLPYILALAVSFPASIIITDDLWYKLLEFINRVPFNEYDPTFGKDISFYIFELPFYKSLAWIFIAILVVLFVATFIYSSLVIIQKASADKRIEIQSALDVPVKGTFKRMWESYRIQMSVFASLALALGGVLFYLKKYTLVYSTNGIVFGASFTDVKVTMPLCVIMAVMCLVAAVGFLIFGLVGKLKPIVVLSIALVAVYFIGLGVGVAIENFIVSPNEYSKEAEFIGYNIEYTQMAYGLDDIETKQFTVSNTIDAEDIENNTTTINNIPVNDYLPTLNTYNSLQGIRTYYQFNDVDVDRYYLDGDYTQVFISAREMNTDNLNADAQTWINTHLKYTHGFGISVAPVNTITETGQPMLIAKDIPTTSDYVEIEVDEPRIYFGELTDGYAVVNTKAKEFDYPAGSNNVENVYEGDAGIDMTLLNRLSFSIRYGTLKFLLSSDINSESRILINRNVVDRVTSIAPFLSYDSDPYLVVLDGKLYWVMDGMTTTDKYPYSQPYYNKASGETFNYIRNSVKVVVDAYNGDVTFYLVDESDPIVNCYAKIYPDLFTPASEMPEGLKAHLRYSEALFNVQAEMYLTYHMDNTSVFYNKEDAWAIAMQYYQESKNSQQVNSSYMIMKLPDREEEFMLIIPYTAVNKNNMVAWMAGVCDGDDYGKLIVYEFPKQSLVYGPMQIEQRIDQDTVIAPQLALLAQQGSDVLRGNLLTVPVEDSLLYIEPVYVRAANNDSASLPEMKKIILSYKDNIIMEDTLSEALETMFGTHSDNGGTQGGGSETDTPINPDSTQAELIAKASKLYDDAQAALKAGDWAAYGEYMDQLGNVLTQLESGSAGATTPNDTVIDETPVEPDLPEDGDGSGN